MRNRILFLFLLSMVIQSAKSQADEQKPSNFYMGHLGFGTSSIQGWSAFCSFSFERKNNEFTVRGVYNNQIGYKKRDFLGFDYYNDRFGDAALLYGRTFRKNFFFTSFSVGPSYYRYTDRFLVKDTITNNWLNNDFSVSQKQYSGIGLACELKLIAILDEEVGVGILAWGDINQSGSFAGVSVAMTIGFLRD